MESGQAAVRARVHALVTRSPREAFGFAWLSLPLGKGHRAPRAEADPNPGRSPVVNEDAGRSILPPANKHIGAFVDVRMLFTGKTRVGFELAAAI
jgi:hypothetical protein